jgi:putative ABC transport system substrate-binding protein
MSRRAFITLLGGAAAWPLAAGAQQRAMPLVAFINSGSAGGFQHLVLAFRQGLKEAGYVEGQNVAVEYRWAEGHYDRVPVLALELVTRIRDVKVIVANTPGVLPLNIVFTTSSDPVQIGLVASLARPGGNVTGATILSVELGPKQLEMARELLPGASSIDALVNPTAPETEVALREYGAAADLHVLHASTLRDLDTVFASFAQRRSSALVIGPDAFFSSNSRSSPPSRASMRCPRSPRFANSPPQAAS